MTEEKQSYKRTRQTGQRANSITRGTDRQDRRETVLLEDQTDGTGERDSICIQ
jgi:hypothetical protein